MSIFDRYEDYMNRVEDEKGFCKAVGQGVIHALGAVAVFGVGIWIGSVVLPDPIPLLFWVSVALIAVGRFVWWAFR